MTLERAPKIEIGEVRNEGSDDKPDEVVEKMAEEDDSGN